MNKILKFFKRRKIESFCRSKITCFDCPFYDYPQKCPIDYEGEKLDSIPDFLIRTDYLIIKLAKKGEVRKSLMELRKTFFKS